MSALTRFAAEMDDAACRTYLRISLASFESLLVEFARFFFFARIVLTSRTKSLRFDRSILSRRVVRHREALVLALRSIIERTALNVVCIMQGIVISTSSR